VPLFAFLVLWLAVAVATTVVMARRGHSWFSWAVVATAFGPLAWPLAVRELLTDRTTVAEPPVEGDVLVAVPPWVRSPRPILAAISAVDPPPREVTLATILDAEDATTVAGRTARTEREAILRRCAGEVGASGLVNGPVRWQLRYGRPADELAELARAGGYREVVLGPSGSAIHHLLHGHTRSRLAHLTSIRVADGLAEREGAS
jgi:hypothetical protein